MPSMSIVRATLLAVLALACPPSFAAAQVAPAAPNATSPQGPTNPVALDATTVAALERLSTLLAEKRAQRDEARSRNDLTAAAALEAELRDLGWQFAGLASHLDVQDFEAPQKRQFDLQQEFEQLIRPLLTTLKDATEEPRQIADLRSRIELLQQRQRTAQDALRAAERTRDALPAGSQARAEADRELAQRWRPALEQLRGEVLVLNARLLARTESRQSLVESLTQVAKNFVQSSGLSLLLAVGVFVTVVFGLRFLCNRQLRRSSSGRGFSLRLLEVVLKALTLLIAIGAMLVVPYVRNDWLLLAVCIVFLLGVGWVLVRMLPQFFEQIRLVLNVGGVREGERILLDGLPFRVDSLRLYSRLQNPDLQGGELRVPIQHLIGKRSRRSADDEPWFPCRPGDVVLLADGVAGAVRTQTPEVVVVDHFGSPRSYPTASFLQQNPRNLSCGFVVMTTFGLDYAHQQEAVTSVPKLLHDALARGLTAIAPGELRHVRVELQAAAPSSLDYVVLAEFAGSAAPRYFELQRLLQSLLVAACTQHGFHIPLPQVMVHRPSA